MRSPDSIDGILGELAEKGTINIRRAYGNWKNQAGWETKLHPFAIQPIQQFAYTKGKNALDMCMAIDAMDLLYERLIGSYFRERRRCTFEPPSPVVASIHHGVARPSYMNVSGFGPFM